MGWKTARSNYLFLAVIVVALYLTACATFNSPSSLDKKDASPTVSSPTEEAKDAKVAAAKAEKSEKAKAEKSAADIENLTIDEVIRIEQPNTANLYDNSRYDFPITINSRVEGWIDYFTGRGRHHMERYLGRSSRYIPVMKQILKKNGMPEDLVYLALIESGFNLRAKSRARAVGPWQFMKATGTRYGLRVDAWIDERRDPLRSTEAAAKYLKDLYLMFESWYLAASAYNAGEYKILRAIDAQKTHNYWRLCETREIRRETKDYIPKLIAAAIIAKNPTKYGFEDVAYEEPLEFDTVTVDFPIQMKDIASLTDTSEEDILDLNPQLARGMVPPTVPSYEVRVPVGSRVIVERALVSMRNKTLPVAEIPKEYVSRRGETLSSIARRFHVRVAELASVNNFSPRERIPAGTSVLIPRRNVSAATPATQASNTRLSARVKRAVGAGEKPAEDGFITHTVRRGESLWSISEKYSVTVQEIFRWNNLKKSRITPGKRLRIRSSEKEGTGSDEASAVISIRDRRRS